MCELHQVATGAYAAMFIDTGNNIFIDQCCKQFDQTGMNTGISLHQTVQSGHQDGFAECGLMVLPIRSYGCGSGYIEAGADFHH